ncbi:methionine--tRNA ligase, partial [Candidatus Gottesmanbacteria bacterium]|nr:methionine--tRNA ligase [Candidatus Gottesmanbacteria bacterium]
MARKFYITAAIPYVNGRPHVGHALEFIQCDVVARYKKLQGYDTLYISGSDENGLKIVQAAEKQNLTPQKLADRNTQVFLDLVKLLNIDIGVWRRGSDKKFHWPGTEKLWRLGEKNGDIYKKMYGGFYCVGCEDFYLKKDLVDGKCPEHLTVPEWVEEENYFFKLSRYQKEIEKLISSDSLLVIPQARKNEVLAFIRSGLEDFSISRSKKRAKNWGIPVPGDDSQVIYTWYDGLNIYQTAVGFGYDDASWKKWWPTDLHVIGKGILRFHAVYWIGMLLSAKLPIPKSIFVHGYISSGGHKMSKSLGNVVDPFEVVERYGTDATRYYLLREIPAHGDGDFTYGRFTQLYNADLANGLGNLIARVSKLAEGRSYHLSLIAYRDVNTGS